MSEKKETDFRDQVKTVPCKILSVDGGKVPDTWWRLSDDVRRITNGICSYWLSWHLQKNSDIAMRKWLEEYLAFVKTRKGKEKGPKCPVDPWPKEFSDKLWRWVEKRYPKTHSRVRTLIINKLKKTFTKVAASRSAFKRWQKILAGDGEFPSFANPLPIPIDSHNSKILDELGENRNHRAAVTLFLERKGKGIKHVLDIKTAGYRTGNIRSIVEGVQDGTYKFCGSNLLYRRNGWCLELCYQFPAAEKLDLDKSRVAYLSPSVGRPVDLWIPNGDGRLHSEGLRRRGRDVQSVLRILLAQQRSRQELYQVQGSSRKGHGRKKAISDWVHKLSQRRKDLKKTYNKQLVSDVVKRCIDCNCGTLVYFQPCDRRRDKRFLEQAGTFPGIRGGVGWEWHQLGSLLVAKCQEKGVELTVRKLSGSGFSFEKWLQHEGA